MPPIRRPWWVLALVPAVMASCSSGGGSGSGGSGGSASASSNATVHRAGTLVQHQMAAYQAAAQKCQTETSPVVCVEGADRSLGGQIHTYANLLAVGHGFTAPAGVVATARNDAQTLANSLEILGDAQPTQANYDKVLNTFDVNGSIAQLHDAVTRLNDALG
jgi:hypothetical protein